MTSRSHWLAISIVAAFSLFTIFTLGQRSVAADEFSMYWAAEKSVQTILKLYFSPYENNPAGPALIQHFWGKIFGYGDESLRLLSLMFVWAALVYLWKLVQFFYDADKPNGDGLSVDIKQEKYASLLVFALAATTPVVWMAANFARYQAMAIFLGVGALYHYLRWFRQHDWKNLSIYVLFTGLAFYVHYLSAAVFALCAGLHYLSTIRFSMLRSRKDTLQILVWGASQLVVILLIVPIVIGIAMTYSQMNLGASPLAATNIGKPVAAVLFFGATVFGLMNGFAVAPWTLWVVLPMACILAWAGFIAFRSPEIARNRKGVFFIALPLVVMSLVVVRMYPPLQFYLIPSVQRVGFLAPFVWVLLGLAIMKISSKPLRYGIIAIALACNLYAITVWNLNVVATQQTPPLREVRDFVLKHSERLQSSPSQISPNPISPSQISPSLTIAHPFGYRYGMESVGSSTKGSATALDRYLPSTEGVFWRETDMTAVVDVDSCKRMVSAIPHECVIVQRNRLHLNADNLAQALIESGFAVIAEEQLQRQSAVDIWFKKQMLKLPVAGFKEDAVPQEFLYTARFYRRR